jgi:light-regulated signal transduction histidine kinase (bacteriophytochrome)
LLLKISEIRRYTLVWFRPEAIRTVNWAGNPHEGVTEASNGQPPLSPRRSFELWQETVRGTALPWQPCELEGVRELRSAIVGSILNKADQLARMNRELERSNQELSSFAYAASHDLKEPLRGIHNYALFLQEDYAELLDEAGIERLQTLVRLSQRMDGLIDVLLRFSQIGQLQLDRQTVDLNELLSRAVEVIRASRPDGPIDIRVPRALPTIACDPVLADEVFRNLLSNAFKYNTSSDPWVEVGYLSADEQLAQGLTQLHELTHAPVAMYIRDNGIGIRDRHREVIFRLFKRLHAQSNFGGGTGAGLTIAKKIVERHGGRIWVDSIPGKGSTFYFTLQGIPGTL